MLVADDPWGKLRTLMDSLPSGSYVAISHPGEDFDPEAMAAVVAAANQGGMTLVPRVRAEVQRFFGDWQLVNPGVVPVMAWRPEGDARRSQRRLLLGRGRAETMTSGQQPSQRTRPTVFAR